MENQKVIQNIWLDRLVKFLSALCAIAGVVYFYDKADSWWNSGIVLVVGVSVPFIVYDFVQDLIIAARSLDGREEPKDFANVFLMSLVSNASVVVDMLILLMLFAPIFAHRMIGFGELVHIAATFIPFSPYIVFLTVPISALSLAAQRDRSSNQLRSIENLKRNWKLLFPPVFFFYTIWRWPARQVYNRFEWVRENVFPPKIS